MKILFVCTGNTCRSPMAMAMLRTILAGRGRGDITVDSAGIMALGQPVSQNTVAALEQWNVAAADIVRDYTSKQVTAEMLDDFEIIIAMSHSHAAALTAMGARLEDIRIPAGGVDDPYGGDIIDYCKVRDHIEAALEKLADELEGNK